MSGNGEAPGFGRRNGGRRDGMGSTICNMLKRRGERLGNVVLEAMKRHTLLRKGDGEERQTGRARWRSKAGADRLFSENRKKNSSKKKILNFGKRYKRPGMHLRNNSLESQYKT